jgi:hypothetical protein
MNKIQSIFWLIVLCLLVSACSAQEETKTPVFVQPPTQPAIANTPIASATVEPLPTLIPSSLPENTPTFLPERLVRLVWFYRPLEDINDRNYLAENFDYFILTGGADEPMRDWLIQTGVNRPIIEYLSFGAIMDPKGCDEQPWGNNVAYKVGDFCDISEKHPDWFLLDLTGKRLHDNAGFYHMDPGNPEWQAFWLQRAIEMQEQKGWNGVFLDNLDAGIGRFLKEHKTMPAKYIDNTSFSNAVEDWLAYMRNNYFLPKNRPMLANITYVDDEQVWFRYLQYLDGAMDEQWAVGWGNDYLDPAEWEKHLTLAEKTQEMGKDIYLVSHGEEADLDRQKFAFASYLLISSGRAYFRYTRYDMYEVVWKYPSYTVDLGQPKGPRYQENNQWRRDFTKGSVTVDPATHKAEIILAE